MKVVTTEQMREIDRISIEERGIPSLILMENAGRAVATEIIEILSPINTAIVTGKGNNAGDGFVVARMLAEKGFRTTVLMLSPPEELKGDAATNYELLSPEINCVLVDNIPFFKNELENYDCIVDAIFGTGFKGAVSGFYAEAINAVNDAEANVVAIDIPSGLPANGGAIEGACIMAQLTVTIGLPKIGMLVHPGIEYTGRVIVADIGFHDDLINDEKIQINLLNDSIIRESLPPRSPQGHKGTFGKLLIIAGSEGMTGAAILCTKAALRSGVGYVYLCASKKITPIFETQVLEPVKIPLQSSPDGYLTEDSLDEILQKASDCKAVIIGPGIGHHLQTFSLVKKIVENIDIPLVIDADAINAIAEAPEILSKAKQQVIITPHPGEMSRLIGISIKDIQANRIDIAREYSKKFNCIMVLKGAQTIIAEPSGQCYINPTGNTGLAKGGSGDVLTGLIGGLRAQGSDALSSSICGVYLHGKAADIASKDINVRSITPSDVIRYLGKAFDSVITY